MNELVSEVSSQRAKQSATQRSGSGDHVQLKGPLFVLSLDIFF